MKIEIIENKEEWTEFLSLIKTYDCYHTYDYHCLAKSDNEIPVLLKYEHLDVLIGIPFLIRYVYNTDYKDLTSVYGYGGPLSKGVTDNFDNETFKTELIKFLKLNNFVTAFSRLNPFIKNQHEILSNLGTTLSKGKIVNIDITKDLEVQRSNYQSRLKTYVNKSRRNCLIKKASSKEDLDEFIDIYYENMKRLKAEDFYFFNKSYFQKLVDSTDFKTEILLGIDKETNKTIAGCLFITSNGIVQYHLSGSKTEFLNRTPIKLLIDEMRITASGKGHKYFNLGGGVGARQDDSLFNFKSAFSKDFKDFYLWKLIVNQEVYNELVSSTDVIEDSDYFPLYRSIKDLTIKK